MTERPWIHRVAEVNDVRLHYVEAGPDSGPLVVLLHGFPEFWYSWRHQIPALAEAGYRVAAPDMRGYNLSERPEGVSAYRIDAVVEDVLALIGHLGESGASVVGHDWGGLVAWALAIGHPDAVDRLAALNAPHPEAYRRALRSPVQLWRSRYVLKLQIPWLPERLLARNDYAHVERLLTEGSVDPDAFSEADLELYREAIARPGALSAALNYYRAAFRGRFRERLGNLRGGEGRALDVRRDVPTLVVWGEQDPSLTTKNVEGLGEWVSDLRVERLPDASHWVQNDRPGVVNDLLLEFFDGDGRGEADALRTGDAARDAK